MHLYKPQNLCIVFKCQFQVILCCVFCKRTEIVPDVHLSAECADLDDGLAQEIVRFTFEMLLHPRLDVVVLVPHAHLDAVGGVVTFAASAQVIKVGQSNNWKISALVIWRTTRCGMWETRSCNIKLPCVCGRVWGGIVRLKGAVGLWCSVTFILHLDLCLRLRQGGPPSVSQGGRGAVRTGDYLFAKALQPPCMAAATAAAAGAFYNIDAAKQSRVAKALSSRRGQDVRLWN